MTRFMKCRFLPATALGLAMVLAAAPVFAPAALASTATDADRPVTIPAAAPAVPEDTSPNATGSLGSISLDQPLRDARDEFERIYFEYHLGRENHSMTRVSEKTGLERTHLYRKLKDLGLRHGKRDDEKVAEE